MELLHQAALPSAAKSRRTSAAKWPLERGADAHVGDGNGCTAVDVAEFVGNVKVTEGSREHYEKERESFWSVLWRVCQELSVLGVGAWQGLD